MLLNITLLKEAVCAGDQFPNTRHVSGEINQVVTVDVPLDIPALSFSENLSVDVLLNGRWTAKSVPSTNGTPDINGNFSGSIEVLAPISITVNVPLLGEETLSLDVAGTFGVSLFVTGPTELTFAGAWAASAGEDGFGGDMSFTMPIDDLKNLASMPFEITGIFPCTPFPSALTSPAISRLPLT